jgi:hypothetical protein
MRRFVELWLIGVGGVCVWTVVLTSLPSYGLQEWFIRVTGFVVLVVWVAPSVARSVRQIRGRD